MTDFFRRLDIYLKLKGLNDNKVTVESGISNGIIGKARIRGALSQDNISKLLNTYTDLDANWLFTGNGEMLKINDKRIEVIQDTKDQYIIELQKDKIGRLEKEIAELKKAKEPHSGYRNVAEP